MKFSNLDKKANISSWLLITFIVIVSISAIFTKLFQRPIYYDDLQHNIKSPIKIEYLTDLEFLQITNNLGSFKVVKHHQEDVSTWDLVSPRELPGNKIIIEQLIDMLSRVKVRKIIPYDSINESNYSLVNPIIKIVLGVTNLDPIHLNIGLINPIDNSTYISFGDKKYIYQIDLLQGKFGTLELSDFVDPYILSIPKEYISQLKIFSGNTNVFQIKRQDDEWFDSGSKLSPEKVDDYLNKLLGLKRAVILDESSPQLDGLIAKYLKRNPAYRIEIISTNAHKYEYLISGIIKESFAEFKIEKKQSLIMSASDRKYPYVINKSVLPIFNIKTNHLRDLNK